MTNTIVDTIRSKRLGVVLSSGFFGFYAHAGFVKALQELRLQPVGYAGSSAGAIIAAFAAAGMRADRIAEILFSHSKKDFWDPEPWPRTMIAGLRLFKGWRGRLEGAKLKKLVEGALPVTTFEELRVPCVIAGTNLTARKRELFVSGNIADAVQASAAVPWLFKFKERGHELFVDGGLVDKAPVAALCDHVQPDVVLVHYLLSRDLTHAGNDFLSKKFSPQKAGILAMCVARHENYRLQKEIARLRGCRVIEIVPDVPAVAPDSIDRGREAFRAAYRQAREQLAFIQP